MLNRMVARCMPLVIAALSVGSVAQAQTGRITGQVTDTAGGRPLEGVAITAADGNRAGARARSGAAGRYTLGVVNPGSMRLQARLIGYGPRDQALSLMADQ